MILIGLFTKYFLLLMVLQGLIVGFIDVPGFIKAGMKDAARKARFLGIGSIVLGILLSILRSVK